MPMTFDQMWAAIRDAGKPPSFLLLDAAGLAGGRAEIPEHIFAELECLFTGDLADELENVGPYLGRLGSFEPVVLDSVMALMRAHVATIVVLRDAEGGEEPSFSDMHRHFRKMNVVYGPEGQALFFRYYDPRVLPDVLSVFEPAQLAGFFGPGVEAVWLCNAEGQPVRCYRQGEALRVDA
jgi:hypothetical protein